MCLAPIYLEKQNIYVPCRKCIECRNQYSSEWAYRVMLEAQKHEHTSFLTLTYADEHLPLNGSLSKRDFQLFMKRLRKALGTVKVRYFACGEYGSPKYTMRPHYHIILFGYDFPDKYFFKFDKSGEPIFRSPFLESLWAVPQKKGENKTVEERSIGFSSVGELSFNSAKYCALYMQADLKLQLNNLLYHKKINKRQLKKLQKVLQKPFTTMSRRPGIALDCIPSSVYEQGALYFDGRKVMAPVGFARKAKELLSCDENGEIVSYYGRYRPPLEGERLQDVEIRRKERSEKYKKIFGKSLDKSYRIIVSLKHKGTVRKT